MVKIHLINYPMMIPGKHKAAKRDGKIPKDAQIGSEVGIHGVPKGMIFD
jgi:hypothetical protein